MTKDSAGTKRGYLRYSPLILTVLVLLAFVFAFSVVILLDQSLLETVGAEEQVDMLPIAFDVSGIDGPVVQSPSEGIGSLTPSLAPVGKWRAITPDAIAPSSLPYLQPVDFNALLARNRDTVAWLYWPTSVDVQGLPFNTSVVQTQDNQHYLDYSFDGSKNPNGWVFADYRCDMTRLSSNYNTVFYGHARSYNRFGGLKYLNTKTRWMQDGYNHFIYINTPHERTVWQVFSWYETKIDFNYIQTYFSSDASYMAFLKEIQSRNTISALEKIELAPTDRIITLSTCKGLSGDTRVAVHAVLVKAENVHDAPSPFTDASGRPSSDSGAQSDQVTDRPSGDPASDSGTVTDRPSGSASSVRPSASDPVTDPPTDPSASSGSAVVPPVTDVTDPLPSGSSGSAEDPVTDVTDSSAGTSDESGTATGPGDFSSGSASDSSVTDSVSDPVSGDLTGSG